MSKGLERNRRCVGEERIPGGLVHLCESSAVLIGCMDLVGEDGSDTTRNEEGFREEAGKLRTEFPQGPSGSGHGRAG